MVVKPFESLIGLQAHGQAYWDAFDQTWNHEFELERAEWRFSDDWPYDIDGMIHVLMGVVFTEGVRLASDADWMSWPEVVDSLPISGRLGATDGEHAPHRRRPPAATFETEPWLWDYFGDPARKHGHGEGLHGDGGGGHHGRDDGDGGEEVFDMDIEDVYTELWGHREEAGLPKKPGMPFHWIVLGGAWTAAHKGVAYDAYKALASSAEAREWAHSYSLPLSASFALARYGEETAAILATFFCDKMNHLWRIHVEEAPGYVYTVADHESYEPDPRFLELCSGPPGAVRVRCEALMAFSAANPV
jgi:hypothetical protein